VELGPSYLNRVAGVEALGGDERDAMDAEKEDKTKPRLTDCRRWDGHEAGRSSVTSRPMATIRAVPLYCLAPVLRQANTD
jgi:hypothetical protein